MGAVLHIKIYSTLKCSQSMYGCIHTSDTSYKSADFFSPLKAAPPIFMAQLYRHKETVALPAPTHTPTHNHQSAALCLPLIQTDNTKHSAKKQSVRKSASVICYEQVL